MSTTIDVEQLNHHMHMNYMLDTCIFNKVLEKKIRLDDIDRYGRWFITPAQRYEINNTKINHPLIWEELSSLLCDIDPLVIPSSTFMFDTGGAGFDESEFNTNSRVNEFVKKINEHPKSKKSKSKQGRKNAVQDALILETALKHDLILVTTDEALHDVAKGEGTTSRYIDISKLAMNS